MYLHNNYNYTTTVLYRMTKWHHTVFYVITRFDGWVKYEQVK